jgi:hypothetical protein
MIISPVSYPVLGKKELSHDANRTPERLPCRSRRSPKEGSDLFLESPDAAMQFDNPA